MATRRRRGRRQQDELTEAPGKPQAAAAVVREEPKEPTPELEPEVQTEAEPEDGAGVELSEVFDKLGDGEAVVVYRDPQGVLLLQTLAAYKLSDVVVPSGGTGRVPSGFWDSIMSDEYKEWHKEWGKNTYEEKLAFARENKLEWKEYPDDKSVDVIRISIAVQQHLGISKWKEGYRSQQERKKAKTRAAAGLDY